MLQKEHYLDNIYEIMKSRLFEKLQHCLISNIKQEYPGIQRPTWTNDFSQVNFPHIET